MVSNIIIVKTSIIFKNFDNFRTFIMISNITSSWEHKCRNQKRTWYIAFSTSYLSVYEVKLHLICMVRVWYMIIVLKYKTKSGYNLPQHTRKCTFEYNNMPQTEYKYHELVLIVITIHFIWNNDNNMSISNKIKKITWKNHEFHDFVLYFSTIIIYYTLTMHIKCSLTS